VEGRGVGVFEADYGQRFSCAGSACHDPRSIWIQPGSYSPRSIWIQPGSYSPRSICTPPKERRWWGVGPIRSRASR
jgi:hypothetical protein